MPITLHIMYAAPPPRQRNGVVRTEMMARKAIIYNAKYLLAGPYRKGLLTLSLYNPALACVCDLVSCNYPPYSLCLLSLS